MQKYHLHPNHDHSGIARFFRGVGAVARGIFQVGKAVVKGVVHLADGVMRTAVDVASGRPLDAIKHGLTAVRTLGRDLADVAHASHALAPSTIRTAMSQPGHALFDFNDPANRGFLSSAAEDMHGAQPLVTSALQHAASAYAHNPAAQRVVGDVAERAEHATMEKAAVLANPASPLARIAGLNHNPLFSW